MLTMKCGLVGLPNVGKSTLFNLFMQKAQAQAENYPFCTIEPNIGEVPIIDHRAYELASISQSKKTLFPTLGCADIAGLVKGAHQGNGLGNQFLSHIRQVDIILHIVRCFNDNSVVHVNDAVNPQEDVELIELELILSDIQICEKWLAKKNQTLKEVQIVKKTLSTLQQFKWLYKSQDFSQEEYKFLRQLGLISILPVLVVANIKDDLSLYHNLCNSIKHKFNIVYINAHNSSNDSLILQKAYDILNLHTFFTTGPQETRGWTIRRGDRAVTAAGKIHTDFMKKFICADVIKYQDFIDYKGWYNCKMSGKIKQEGKNYSVSDGDVINFKVNR